MPGMTLAGEQMSRRIVAVEPRLALSEVWRLMTGGRIRHVLVVDGERLVGIVSDRDVLLRAELTDDGELTVPGSPVSESMTRTTHVCSLDTPVSELIQMMLRHNIDAIPVLDDEEHVAGLVTTRDLLSLLASVDNALEPVPFDFEIERM
jgi:acetoin utilization protein AcuB